MLYYTAPQLVFPSVMPGKCKSKKKSSAQDQSPPWNVAKAPAGIICNPMLSQPPLVAPAPPANARSHEIMGGIILGSGHHDMANKLNLRPNPTGGQVPRYSKSKYVGVTYRAIRDKYQSRIYKDNREYNLGLYDVAADGAFAYDTAHRLMAKVSGGNDLKAETPQLALSKLDELEKDNETSSSFDWFGIIPSRGKDCESLNFNSAQEYEAARQKEITDRKLEPRNTLEDERKGTYPEISLLKVMIRQEAIRVVKAVISHGAGMDDGKKRKRGDRELIESEPSIIPSLPNAKYPAGVSSGLRERRAVAQGEMAHGSMNDMNVNRRNDMRTQTATNMNPGAMNRMEQYGIQYGTYPQVGGMDEHSKSSYAQNNNPVITQQCGRRIPMRNAMLGMTGDNIMLPNMNGQQVGNVISMALAPAEEAHIVATYGHSIESIDQRMTFLLKQKQKLEKMLMDQMHVGATPMVQSGMMTGVNSNHSNGATLEALNVQFLNEAPAPPSMM